MATNYQQEGKVIPWPNDTGSTVAKDSVVKMTNTLGIAKENIADGEIGPVAVEGVFYNVPKVPGAVFAIGEKLIWDVSAGAFAGSSATPDTGDVIGGATAWAAGTAGQTTCTVKLGCNNTTVA